MTGALAAAIVGIFMALALTGAALAGRALWLTLRTRRPAPQEDQSSEARERAGG